MVMLRMRSSLICLLLMRVAHAYIYPVMQCSNENAQPNECSTEVKGAIHAVASWFHPYIVHEDENDRRLLECSRFCKERTYFIFHAPCDCTDRRLLVVEPSERRKLATEDSTLEGPLQVLDKHIQTLPTGRCRDVLSQSRCFLNFVTEYDKTIESEGKTFDDEGAVPGFGQNGMFSIPGLELIEAEEYDPVTHEASLIDTATGEKTHIDIDYNPEDAPPSTFHEIEGLTVLDEEKYDPNTGETVVLDPNDSNDPRGEDPTNGGEPDNRIGDNLGSGLGGAPPDDDPDDVDHPLNVPP